MKYAIISTSPVTLTLFNPKIGVGWYTKECLANTIINIIEYDGISELNLLPNQSLVQVSDNLNIGDLYND